MNNNLFLELFVQCTGIILGIIIVFEVIGAILNKKK
jgi:hypothetical protein